MISHWSMDDMTRTEAKDFLTHNICCCSFGTSPVNCGDDKCAFGIAVRTLCVEERPQSEWIPVSERLPKIDVENGWKASDVVLVCLADEKIHMGFYCEDKKWRFCESGEEKEPFWKDVIAWQPLPEPYKEA